MPEITTDSKMSHEPRTEEELERERKQLWIDDASDLLDFLDAHRFLIGNEASQNEVSIDLFFTDPDEMAQAVIAIDANEIDHAGHWHIVRRPFGVHRIDLNIRTSDLEYPCEGCSSE